MRNFLWLTFTSFVLSACGQNKLSKVTVLLFENRNPNLDVTVDTLLKAKEFNYSAKPIDLFYACKNFHLPYYVPTEGIFKNLAKDKECDMKIYPANVKCYEYDEKKRVVKMTVNGSGTMNEFIYKYNDKNKIIEIMDFGKKFILEYNTDGNLSQLRQSDGVINKKLIFIFN